MPYGMDFSQIRKQETVNIFHPKKQTKNKNEIDFFSIIERYH